MTKFQKFQLYFSIVPGVSSALAFIVTMFELKRHCATAKEWIKFFAVFFGFGVLSAVINGVLLTDINPIINTIVYTLIMVFANYLCIRQQTRIETRSETQEFNHRRATIIIWIISGVIVLIGLVLALMVVLGHVIGSSHIEDQNGAENTSLAVITAEDFVSVNNDYASTLHSGSHTGTQSNVTGLLDEVDYDRCSSFSKKISGICTLQATQTDANSITLSVESTLDSGNMEIIIVIDGEYYQHIPVNSKQTIVLEDISGKLVLVKMAAESAGGKVVVERTIGV